jgi:DNA-directed RNA polymerase subunit N (RpoN/RPB10)
MLAPIRCFTCNAVVADLHAVYLRHMRDGHTRAEALNYALGPNAPACCRTVLMSTPPDPMPGFAPESTSSYHFRSAELGDAAPVRRLRAI